MNENATELLELQKDLPIRKIILYKSSQNPMHYEVNRVYARGKIQLTSIEYTDGKYFIFVNKLDSKGQLEDYSLLWKVETAPEISVEYDLEFVEL